MFKNCLKLLSVVLTAMALLIGCAGTSSTTQSAEATYTKKVAMLRADMLKLEKSGFIWKNNTMKGKANYVSVALEDAEKALGKDCQFAMAQICR